MAYYPTSQNYIEGRWSPGAIVDDPVLRAAGVRWVEDAQLFSLVRHQDPWRLRSAWTRSPHEAGSRFPGPGAGATGHQRLRIDEIVRQTIPPLRRIAPGMSSTRPTVSLDRDPEVGPSPPASAGFDGVAFGSADLRFDPPISLLRSHRGIRWRHQTGRTLNAERYTSPGSRWPLAGHQPKSLPEAIRTPRTSDLNHGRSTRRTTMTSVTVQPWVAPSVRAVVIAAATRFTSPIQPFLRRASNEDLVATDLERTRLELGLESRR